MKEQNPLISVVIPTYNRPEMVCKAVDSVLTQTYKHIELIVVDDGEKVRAKKVLRDYIQKGLVTYLDTKKNQGGGAARNMGIRYARGEYIAFLDDDDEWKPEKLEVQVDALNVADADVGFSFTAVENVYQGYTENTSVFDGARDFSLIALTSFKTFLTVTLVIKKDVFDDVGFFDETFPSHQEADLMIRVTQKYRGVGINKPLVLVHMSDGDDHVGGNIRRRIEGRKKILEKYKELYFSHPALYALQWYRFFFLYRDAKEYKEAAQALRTSLKYKKDIRVFLRYCYFLILKK